ncbi:MAG: SagB/ThcOx family dehydrogenase [Sulfurimonadaceae bacterium]
MAKEENIVKLPKPTYAGNVSVEEAMLKRRSVREYKKSPLELSEISQLLWAAQGVTDPRGLRTAPSAGALYPLEIYLVASSVKGLDQGVYKYSADRHVLKRVIKGERQGRLYWSSWAQKSVKSAQAVVVITAVYKRTTGKYGNRGVRYVHMEVGHAAQNIYLQAVSLGLGTVVIGAFNDSSVKKEIGAQKDEEPLCIMPIGKR